MKTNKCSICGEPKYKHHYLCLGCWFKLPLISRERLVLRDSQAAKRLKQLLKEIKKGTPLHSINIAY